MANKRPTKKEAEKLQKQIDEYEAKPVKTNEQPFKLNMSFTEAIDKIMRTTRPPKKSKDE